MFAAVLTSLFTEPFNCGEPKAAHFAYSHMHSNRSPRPDPEQTTIFLRGRVEVTQNDEVDACG
jgi:hypothetical protein